MTIRRHFLILAVLGSMSLPELGFADAVTEWNAIAQAGIPAGNSGAPGARHSLRPDARQNVQTLTPRLSVGVARLPASASADVSRTACVPDAAGLGAVCGYVKVPLDRAHPEGKSIPIYFELYSHSGPGPAESAIPANTGGPGNTTSGARFDFLDLFAPNMDVHDLLLIDDRGRGLSGVLGVATTYVPVKEQDGEVIVKVQRTGGSAGAVSIACQAQSLPADSSPATAGQDYAAVSGRLTWSDGDSNDQEIHVPIVADNIPELDKTFYVKLSDPQGGAGLATQAANVTITGDRQPTSGGSGSGGGGGGGGGSMGLVSLLLLAAARLFGPAASASRQRRRRTAA